jgi:hypothetical protein
MEFSVGISGKTKPPGRLQLTLLLLLLLSLSSSSNLKELGY